MVGERETMTQTIDDIVAEIKAEYRMGPAWDIVHAKLDRLAERLKPVIEELEKANQNWADTTRYLMKDQKIKFEEIAAITVKKNALFQELVDAEAKIDQQAAEIKRLRLALIGIELMESTNGIVDPALAQCRNFARAALAELTPQDGEG